MVPKIFPSLVNGSTAVQSGSTVTVTATAHGIPATIYDGWKVWRIQAPQTLLLVGIPDFQYLTANTFSFTAADSKTVASESVNGGVFVSPYVEFRLGLPFLGILWGKTGVCLAEYYGRDTTASYKTLRTNFGGSVLNAHSIGASPMMVMRYPTFNMNSETKQRFMIFPETLHRPIT